MTTVTTIAQRILDENGWTVADTGLTLINAEYIIENAVDYVNLTAGTSIAFTPAAGAASLTATDHEIVAVKMASTLMIRAYLDRGPNTSLQGMSLTAITGDPQYSFYSDLLAQAIQRLRTKQGIAFVVAEDTSGIS